MKKLCLLLGLLVSTLLIISVSGQNDSTIISERFGSDVLNLTDGKIDPNWNNISYYASLAEYGSDAYVKFANNETHMFSLFKFDASLSWVAIEFGAYEEFCMARGNDGWTFYLDQANNQEFTAHDEIYRGSAGPPEHDAHTDISTEAIHDGDYFYVEVVRAFDTGDAEDMAFTDGALIQVKFASSTHHATGGAVQLPTEFGPSQIYFLSIQTGGEIVVPVVPETIDYEFWKMVIFISIFIAVTIFIVAHYTVRQVYRPLHHPNSIVDSDYQPPTLKSRWHETFPDHDRKDEDEDSKEKKEKLALPSEVPL